MTPEIIKEQRTKEQMQGMSEYLKIDLEEVEKYKSMFKHFRDCEVIINDTTVRIIPVYETKHTFEKEHNEWLYDKYNITTKLERYIDFDLLKKENPQTYRRLFSCNETMYKTDNYYYFITEKAGEGNGKKQ